MTHSFVLIMLRRILPVCMAALVPSAAMAAQRADSTRLGVQGTAAYNMIFYRTALRSDGLRNSNRRFSGRIAMRMSSRTYLGLSVGSWQYDIGVNNGVVLDGLVAALVTGVVYSPYVQMYPLRRDGFFLRGGLGIATTQTYLPYGNEVIEVVRRTAGSITGGLGVDLKTGRHLAVTVSADYTALSVDPHGHEGKGALFVGLGLTLK